MKFELFKQLEDIQTELIDGNEFYEPLDLHSISECYNFISWLPELEEKIEVVCYPNGYVGLSFRKGLDNAELVFEKDYIIWVRNIDNKIESGKLLKCKYATYHALSEILKLFD